jgi:uncharacterized protein YjiK/phosphodiesterase/alkaline phosphatase D-like protein
MAFTDIDLSKYTRVGRYNLPEPTRTKPPTGSLLAQEVSAVTYNSDTDSLFVLGDGGTSIVQVDKTGKLINSMTLALDATKPQGTTFYDPEGLAYVGKGQFVFVEERDRQVNLFTYKPDTTLTRADVKTVKLGTTIGNIGIEGISYDPQTSGFIAVKEEQPEGIFQTTIDFDKGTASNGSPTTIDSTNLFDPALAGLTDFADVFALSNLTALNGKEDSSHLLVLSQADGKIVEVDRAGKIYSSLKIVTDADNKLSLADQQHEGLTVDKDGFLYITSENGGGDVDHPQLWVYAPNAVTTANLAPTAVFLNNLVPAITENTSTTLRIKIADVGITDDGQGTNNLTITGADAKFFEADNTGLYIKAGTVLDYETKTSYSATVNVDDTTVGITPDLTKAFTLAVTDVVNETIATPPSLVITEVAPWASGNSPYKADWFEVTNTGTSAVDITGWKFDDNSNDFALAAPLSGITSIAAGQSVIFIESIDPAADKVAAVKAAFKDAWFGSKVPSNFSIGSYTGGGVGLSTGGDAVNLYNATGTLITGISFGASVTTDGKSASFDNKAGLGSTILPTPVVAALSAIETNGGFLAADSLETGSPGTTLNPNKAPTDLVLSNLVNRIAENTNTVARVKVADIAITDDGQGTNNLSLAGADASTFEIFNNALYIKSGTNLDYEVKNSYSVSVNIDDPSLGATPDATKTFILSLTDVTLGAFSGVAAGDATSNDAILWTRTFDPITNKGVNSNLTAQVSTDANFGSIAFSYKILARTDALDHDGTIKIDATGLASGTKYYYRFLNTTGEFSQVGTFKTAPSTTAKTAVRFGFSGDYDGQMRPYSSTADFGKLNLDFFGNVGDTIYETASTGSPAAADAAKDPAQALIDYHRKYLENLQPVNPGGFASLQTFFASQGNYTQLDNHELGNKQLINGGAPGLLATNAGNGTNNTAYDVNKTGTFINQNAGFKSLIQAYTDYQPIKEKLLVAPDDARSNGTQQLYNSQQWGQNVLYINTDTRSYRDVRLKTTDAAGAITTTDDTGARADNPDRTLLGKTQLAWLKQNLLDAQKNGTAWKFVAIADPIDQIGAIGSGVDGGKSWIGGYRAERNDLLKFIADNGIKNVIFLSCDDHQNRINELTYLDNINDPTSIKVLPGAISVVDGPIGATGPDTITDHSFANVKALADKLAAKQVTDKVNPIGLDPNYAGLKNVYREGDPNADTTRQAIDFYSPDTFNYTTFDVSADGKTLNVTVQGINSSAVNTFQEPSAANPVRTILSFSLDADVPPTLVSGSTGADNLIAGVTPGFSPSNNIVFTGAGKDTVDIAIAGNAASNNRVDLGSGNDVIYIANSDWAFGSAGDDEFEAGEAKDYRVSGGAGNDTFYLGSNGRTLGGDGNDKFFATTGGGNLLSGGAGADQFWIANAELPTAANTILDFQIGTDVIGIQGAKSLGISSTSLVLNQVGDDTSIGFGGQTLAILKGIQVSSLTLSSANQFVFA